MIHEWLKRSKNLRSPHHVLVFYRELLTSDSYLLSFRCSSDKYQQLAAWLQRYTVDTRLLCFAIAGVHVILSGPLPPPA